MTERPDDRARGGEGMQLQVGKKYLTRSGQRVVVTHKTDCLVYKFGGHKVDEHALMTWKGDGSNLEGVKRPHDIVAELPAPTSLTSTLVWIPVSERLPEDGAHRLIAMESNLGSRFVTEAFWDEHSEQWVYVGNNMPVNLTVTHWAELPRPPASEEREG